MHQPTCDRVKPWTTVALDVLADDLELTDSLDQRPWHLGPFPVVADRRQDLVVDERADAAQRGQLLLAELFAQEEVVGGARLTEVVGQRRGDGAHGALLDR